MFFKKCVGIPAGFLLFRYFGCLKMQSFGSFLTELHAAARREKSWIKMTAFSHLSKPSSHSHSTLPDFKAK